MKKSFLFIVLTLYFFTGYSQTSAGLDNEQLLDMVQGQRYREAANYIRSFYPDIITDSKIRSRLAYCNYMSGNLPEAEKTYLAILNSEPNNRTALNYLAAINEQRLNHTQAKTFYERMLSLDTLNFIVYKKLANNAENRLDTTGMLNNLLKASSLNAQDPDIAYDLSKLLILYKRYPEADTVLSRAIAADPQNIFLINGRMELANKQKNYKSAATYAKQAIELGDNAPQTLNVLGISYYYLKEYTNCINIYRLLEKYNGSNETTYYYTALAYRKLDSLQKSNEYLTKSIIDGISDNVAVYYHELSINNESLKRYRTSITQLDKAEQYSAENIFNYSRARIYDINLNDPQNALRYYKRYIKEFNPKTDDKECYNYSAMRIKDLSQKSAIKR